MSRSRPTVSTHPRLVVVTTHPVVLRVFAQGLLADLRSKGYEVIAVSSPGPDLEFVSQREGVQTFAVPMQREPRPLADLVALFRLWRLFQRLRPTIVNAGTPKAGLLGMVAAWLARVPVRVYTIHGLRLETTRGLKRKILSITERIASWCATRVVCVSESLREVCIEQGLLQPAKSRVLLNGSVNGVDVERFRPTESRRSQAQALREKFGIPPTAPVIGSVSRLVRDKGIVYLLDAFRKILAVFPDARWLAVGEFEESDPLPPEYIDKMRNHPQIILPGFIHDLGPVYAVMDVVAFPTLREGFGYVAIEAGAAGLPVVAFRTTGVVDTIQDGVTGTLVPVGDTDRLAEGLIRYLRDPALRAKHGEAAHRGVATHFRQQDVWEAWSQEYTMLLQQCGFMPPRKQKTEVPQR